MPLVAYPAGLPAPLALLRVVPRERRAVPPHEGAFEPSGRQRDFAGGMYEATWVYSPAEMATWRAWYEGTLLHGLLRFAEELPLNGGISNRVVRYIGSQQREHLGAGNFRVTSQLEVRGASELPQIPELAAFDGVTIGEPWALSNSNQTATGTYTAEADANGTCRSVNARDDNRYIEFTLDFKTGGGFALVGICTPDHNMSLHLGNSSDSAGYYNTGENNIGGGTLFDGLDFVMGDTVMVAIRGATGHIFTGVNGVWNNSGDPAADTGYVLTLPGELYHAAVSQDPIRPEGYSIWTGRFTGADLQYPAPSGFVAWDD